MRKSVIKAKLAQNKPVLLTQLHFQDPSVFELTGLMGFDGIWMDMEHHAYSIDSANNLMRAARAGGQIDILARAANGEFARIARLLEAGAHGIMYPRCADAKEAATLVQWTKFAPLGKRGFDGGNPDMPYCTMPMPQYIREANEQTFLLAQIEEQSALEQVERIAEVEGIDVIFLGPADFSVLGGFPGQWDHPLMSKAVERIAKAAKAAGKHWGCPAFNPEHAKKMLDMGARLLCHNADIIMVKTGLERIQEQFAPLGFTFANKLTGKGEEVS